MDPRIPRLLEIARAIGLMRPDHHDDPQLAALTDEARGMLAAGLDPNDTDSSAQTALGCLAATMRGNNREQIAFANLLLEHGANPMMGDKPLGPLISHRYSSFLVTNTLMALARAETSGHGLRDENGGCVLHYLAKTDPQLAVWQLREDVGAVQDGDIEHLFFPDPMINATRSSDGASVLDVLWLENRNDPDAHDLAWKMTQVMIERGADPFAPTLHGQCVFQEMDRLIKAGAIQPAMHVWGPLSARWSQRSMLDDTAHLPARAPAPRL